MKPILQKIAVIDDSSPFRWLVKNILEMQEYDVHLFEEAELFFKEKWTPPGYHLIIVDLNLPGMNGVSAVENIKQSPLTASVPVLFVTGDASRNNLTEAVRAGVNDFISKPIDPALFLERVNKLLGLKP
ncbi:response regulator [Paenibacillus koleovorans]|uniref:response regulator n=1 Tax=Paenibacillus koleovorans TaxID=121608 RepID=UPI000FD8EF78|nr:response regulator [Paenibacillus koleovorans]